MMFGDEFMLKKFRSPLIALLNYSKQQRFKLTSENILASISEFADEFLFFIASELK